MSKESTETRFFTAIILGDLPTVQEIVPENPQCMSWLTPAGYPPLHMAILNRRADIAVYLAEQGADLNEIAAGDSAAYLADNKGMLEILRDASSRSGDIRAQAISACGERMPAGLKEPLNISRQPLRFKRGGGPKL